MNEENRSKKNGYTLIEVLVSSAIIILISTLFLANYRGSEKKSLLNLTAQKLVSDIRLAQSKSLSASSYGSVFPTGGWGIYFDKALGEYYIFADINGDYAYNAGEGDKALGAMVVKLPENIGINSIQYGASLENTANNLAVAFLPPEPTVYIAGQEYYQAKITLVNQTDSSTKSVLVNFFGLVDAE